MTSTSRRTNGYATYNVRCATYDERHHVLRYFIIFLGCESSHHQKTIWIKTSPGQGVDRSGANGVSKHRPSKVWGRRGRSWD
eukprot:2911952-Pyramimonas_sp.AAC.1